VNTFAIVILVALVGEYLLGAVSTVLSSRSFGPRVPAEFTGVFNDEKYARARSYTATRARFGVVRGALGLAVTLVFWFAGGFAWLDSLARGLGKGPVVTGLVFIGALMFASTIFQLPFRAWSTFVIEGRYGFNRTTAGTFGADLLKGAAPAVRGGHLTDEQQQRRAAHGRVVHRHRGVRGPRSPGHEGHPQVAAQAGLRLGHDPGAGLVAAHHGADARLVVQGVEHGQETLARHREDGVHAVPAELIDQHPPAVAHRRFHASGSSRNTRARWRAGRSASAGSV